MSRAADQRVVYALKNGRLVPKSEVLGAMVAGGKSPATEPVVPEIVVAEPANFVEEIAETATTNEDDAPRRRGRPPRNREAEASDFSDFEIKD